MEGYKNRAMAVKEDEDVEEELELGLSIGGSCYRRKKNGTAFECEKIQVCMDPKTKREIHALRRQEAKKKMEEKQLKRALCKGYLTSNGEINNGMWLKGRGVLHGSNKEVDLKEEPECKKIKIQAIGSDHSINLHLKPVLPVQYPSQSHPPVRPANGFVYPCENVSFIPCWFTGAAASEERNVVPVVGYGFVPLQNGSDSGHNLCNGYDSSRGSERRSSSREGGGGSSCTRSHSSPSVAEQSHSKANETKGQLEQTATSHLTEAADSLNGPINHAQKMVQLQSNSDQSSPKGSKEQQTVQSNSDQSSPTGSKEEAKKSEPDPTEENPMGKPQSQNQINTPDALPYMPCVSTTGNGPNGKTVNGFLYRYTKTDVSIICVCHGTSFTPAEFVHHAGGTDVSHPLRHITVIPSAF